MNGAKLAKNVELTARKKVDPTLGAEEYELDRIGICLSTMDNQSRRRGEIVTGVAPSAANQSYTSGKKTGNGDCTLRKGFVWRVMLFGQELAYILKITLLCILG